MRKNTNATTVLLVEDEQALADLYAEFLASTYTVITAYGGTEALEKMSDDVDVVLLDRRMPGLTGEEVLQAIREDGYDCRVAMVTAVTPDIDIIEMGFDDYLTKPVDSEALHETVEHLAELDTYDDLIAEYYQLTSKKAVLEDEQSNSELSASREFTQLATRLDELATELRANQETTADFDIRSLIDRPGRRSTDGY